MAASMAAYRFDSTVDLTGIEPVTS